MELKRLDWDCRFFEAEVFGIHLHPADPAIDVEATIASLREEGAALAYFFLEKRDAALQEQLEKNGAVLYDEKITYGKELGSEGSVPPGEVRAYGGGLSDELLKLVLLAGHDSRFRKDPRLSAYFERLYTLWIENSLNGSIADRVFVYGGDKIKGMATCKIREDRTGSIGLIATGTAYQGQGIGRALLQATDHYYRANAVKTSTVVTQKTNEQACLFYEKEGFTEYKTEYVYHLWFN